jgi:hypothetical protein
MPNRRHAIPHLPQPLLGRRVRAARPGARALQQALRARPVAEARKGLCELRPGSMRLGRLASSIGQERIEPSEQQQRCGEDPTHAGTVAAASRSGCVSLRPGNRVSHVVTVYSRASNSTFDVGDSAPSWRLASTAVLRRVRRTMTWTAHASIVSRVP